VYLEVPLVFLCYHKCFPFVFLWTSLLNVMVTNSLCILLSLDAYFEYTKYKYIWYAILICRLKSCYECRCNNVLYLRGVPEDEDIEE
jgi:bacteriorhodopsin